MLSFYGNIFCYWYFFCLWNSFWIILVSGLLPLLQFYYQSNHQFLVLFFWISLFEAVLNASAGDCLARSTSFRLHLSLKILLNDQCFYTFLAKDKNPSLFTHIFTIPRFNWTIGNFFYVTHQLMSLFTNMQSPDSTEQLVISCMLNIS